MSFNLSYGFYPSFRLVFVISPSPKVFRYKMPYMGILTVGRMDKVMYVLKLIFVLETGVPSISSSHLPFIIPHPQYHPLLCIKNTVVIYNVPSISSSHLPIIIPHPLYLPPTMY